ncbi:MAG: hypothetical protein ACFFA6_16895 [Promethearchaeota archaeon]
MDDKLSIRLIIFFSAITIIFYLISPFVFRYHEYIRYFYNLLTVFIPSFIIIIISGFVVIIMFFYKNDPKRKYILSQNLIIVQILLNILAEVFSIFLMFPYYIGLFFNLAAFLVIRIKLNEFNEYGSEKLKQIAKPRKILVIILFILIMVLYIVVTSIFIGTILVADVLSTNYLAITQLLNVLDIFGYKHFSFISLFIIPAIIVIGLNIKTIEINYRYLMCQILSLISVLFASFSMAFFITFFLIHFIGVPPPKLMVYLLTLYGITFILTLVAFILLSLEKRKT